MFYGEKLQQLRELEGFSRKDLGKKLNVSEQTIGQYENNQIIPRSDILQKIQDIFDVKNSYFTTPLFIKENIISEDRIAYRSKDKQFRKKTKLELTYLTFVDYFINYFSNFAENTDNNFFRLKNYIKAINRNIDDIDQKINNAATSARKFFQLTNNNDLMFKLESSGIFILEKDLGKTIDAYSGYSNDGKSYIVLGNIKKSAVRRNFDLAHELGHLLLHYDVNMDALTPKETKELESQANSFASIFLLPKKMFVKDFSTIKRKSNPDFYVNMKQKYKVSIAALELRAYKLKLLTEQQNRYFWAQMNKKNYKINEPLDNKITPIKPAKIKSILEFLLDNEILSIHDLTNIFQVKLDFYIKLFDLKENFFDKYLIKEENKTNPKIIDITSYIQDF